MASKRTINWISYLQGAGIVMAATVVGLPFQPFIDPTNLVMLYLLTVVVTALRLGRGPSIAAAFLSVLAFDIFFVPPRFQFVVADAQYLLTFLGLLVVGLVISALAVQARNQAQAAQRRERETAASHHLGQELGAAVGRSEIVETIIQHVVQTFGCEVAVFLPDEMGDIDHSTSAGYRQSEADQAVASSLLRAHHRSDGDSRLQTHSQTHYFPLSAAHRVVGVLGLQAVTSGPDSLFEQQRLLESFASQAALALERVRLAEKARQAELLQATEKLQAALLNSISHDLRTPLSTVTGALSSLQENWHLLAEETKHELIETAWEEADHLNRLVGNLLDMTRLEAGVVQVMCEPCDVQDLLGVVLAEMGNRLADRPVEVHLPDELALVSMDFVLMVQVLTNLLDNAVKYSPAGTPVVIEAQRMGETMQISVADQGIGIPAAEQERVFDKFYRVKRADAAVGTGLGLSIGKGIVEAHKGEIHLASQDGGGTIVTVVLPLGEERASQRFVGQDEDHG